MDFPELFASGPEWKDERDIVRALKENGHQVEFLPIHADVEELISQINQRQPDIIFYSCEAVRRRRDWSHRLLGLLDLLEIPYTGANTQALQICSDKALTKKILTYHEVAVPRFEVWDGSAKVSEIDLGRLRFPVIVKPLTGEGSEGIHLNSVTQDEESCRARMSSTIAKFPGGVIIEEYIHGREIYVGMLGNSEIEVLKPREFVFAGSNKSDRPMVATYRAKWDDDYRKKQGIKTKNMRTLNPELAEAIEDIARRVHGALNIQGYLRLDLRIDDSNQVHVLEANPNPAISKTDDFAAAAAHSGISYNDLIQRILELGLARSA